MNFNAFSMFFTFITIIYTAQPMMMKGTGDICMMPNLIRIYESKLYFGTFSKMNWFNSYQFCRYHGMQLLSLKSLEQLHLIIDYINSSAHNDSHYWVSGNDLGAEGKYVWMSTGESIKAKSSLWAPNQPDNAGNNEDCLQLFQNQGYMLNDHQCLLEFYFICETNTDLDY